MKKNKIVALIAVIIGFLDSAYLTIIKFSNLPIYCTPGLGHCEAVQNSVYSTLWGIPIALLGWGTYTILLLTMIFQSKIRFLQRRSSYILFGIGLFGFLYSLYLTWLELFVIHAICQWCILSAICMAVIFVTIILDLPDQQYRSRK